METTTHGQLIAKQSLSQKPQKTAAVAVEIVAFAFAAAAAADAVAVAIAVADIALSILEQFWQSS